MQLLSTFMHNNFDSLSLSVLLSAFWLIKGNKNMAAIKA